MFTRGVIEGWADPCTDPTQIDWAARQASAAIPFEVVDGRPVSPAASTGIRYGRGELGHWGEAQAADAVVTAHYQGSRWLLMVEREDGYGWALPGGHVDPGETATAAAVRELAEETGLWLPAGVRAVAASPRLVPDPRATDEAWMVTTPVLMDLGPVDQLPVVVGGDDAARAAWLLADSYTDLAADMRSSVGFAGVFAAHRRLIAEVLDGNSGVIGDE